MAETDSGHTATDIITYIGVPLAVLGVLPIIFNTVVTLTALSKIKRMLRHSKLTALTRSDVVNRVIEVELPRYAVTPWDRFNQKAEYWQLSRQPSLIPGGSWTTLNWKIHTIGNKTQRLVYADQLRQPQVEVTFEELVAYLLDLGAIPDAHGWRLLRSTGLWAPVGCPLMSSPGGHKALSIAPLDDSDGHLSLAVNWSSSWTTRDFLSVPPFWVRLPPPLVKKFEEAENGEASSSHEAPKLELQDAMENIKKDHESMGKQSIDSTSKQAQFNAMTEITCQISVDGLITALSHESEISNTATNLHSLYIEHLRIRRGPSHGVWFASAATAYGTTSQTVLWNYTIPDEVLNFSQKNSLPCGVLVLLGVVEEQETPEWATRHDVSGETHELFVRRMAEQRLAVQAESRMPPAQRELAVKDRMQKEMQQRLQDMRDKSRLDTQRREMRTLEALQSPKWSTKLVAERNLAWLKAKGYVNESMALKDVVGTLLHRMVLDGQFSSTLCTMLELWKAFYENGGMRKSDFDALRDDQETFAYASLLLALINETTMTQQGTLAMDLQECLRMWKTVRLG